MWTCIKCSTINDDACASCPKCGAARSVGRFGSTSQPAVHNAQAYSAPIQQRPAPMAEPSDPPHASISAPQAMYYADFSHVRAGRMLMLLGTVLSLAAVVLTLLLAWRQYDALCAAVLGLLFADVSALPAFVRVGVYCLLSLFAAALSSLPGVWTLALGKALHRLSRMEELL